MKKTTIYLFMISIFCLMAAVDVHALDLGKGINLGFQDFLLLVALNTILLFVSARIIGMKENALGKSIGVTLGVAGFFFFILVLTAGKNVEVLVTIVIGILSIFLIQRVFNITLAKSIGIFLLVLIANAIAISLIQKYF